MEKLCWILLAFSLQQGVVSGDVCEYEDLGTGATFTQICSYGCCESDCCTYEQGRENSTGAVIGGVVAAVFFVVFISVWLTCRLHPSCPLAKWRRAVVVRRTIVVTRQCPPGMAQGPPANFNNPLANPVAPGYTPAGPPPSYDQAVPPTFTPLPVGVASEQPPADPKV